MPKSKQEKKTVSTKKALVKKVSNKKPVKKTVSNKKPVKKVVKKLGVSPSSKLNPKSKYFSIVQTAILGLNSRVGASIHAIEKYLQSNKIEYLPYVLKESIKRFVDLGRLRPHFQHPNSFCLTPDFKKPVSVETKTAKTSGSNSSKKSKTTKKTAEPGKSKSQGTPSASKAKTSRQTSASSSPSTSSSSSSTSSSSSSPSTSSSTSSSSSSSSSHIPSSSIVPGSGLASQGSIYSDLGETYNIDLQYQDTKTNSNKFYKLQIIQSHSNSESFWCVQNWGRIGSAGSCKVTGPTNKDEALKIFLKMYKEKSGGNFADRHLSGGAGGGGGGGGSTGGKYSLVELRAKEAGGRLADSNTVTFCLAWSARCDLDIHVKCPDGQNCFYANKQVSTTSSSSPSSSTNNRGGGVYCALDVDKRSHDYPNQVENIYLDTTLSPKGQYIFSVNVFSKDSSLSSLDEIPYQATFNNRGESQSFSGNITSGMKTIVQFVLL